MPSDTTQRFIEALQKAEQTRDPAPLIEQFDDRSELETLLAKAPSHGRSGARDFWTRYLDSFGSISSRFTHVREVDDAAVLEWVSEGTLPDGRPIRYSGVSILELADGRVRKFRTYYDSAAFVTEHPDDATAANTDSVSQ